MIESNVLQKSIGGNLLKERSEIEEIYKWNLDSLYPSVDSFEDDFKLTSELFEVVKKMEGKVLEGADTLFETLKAYFDASIVISRLTTYSKKCNR